VLQGVTEPSKVFSGDMPLSTQLHGSRWDMDMADDSASPIAVSAATVGSDLKNGGLDITDQPPKMVPVEPVPTRSQGQLLRRSSSEGAVASAPPYSAPVRPTSCGEVSEQFRRMGVDSCVETQQLTQPQLYPMTGSPLRYLQRDTTTWPPMTHQMATMRQRMMPHPTSDHVHVRAPPAQYFVAQGPGGAAVVPGPRVAQSHQTWRPMMAIPYPTQAAAAGTSFQTVPPEASPMPSGAPLTTITQHGVVRSPSVISTSREVDRGRSIIPKAPGAPGSNAGKSIRDGPTPEERLKRRREQNRCVESLQHSDRSPVCNPGTGIDQ